MACTTQHRKSIAKGLGKKCLYRGGNTVPMVEQSQSQPVFPLGVNTLTRSHTRVPRKSSGSVPTAPAFACGHSEWMGLSKSSPAHLFPPVCPSGSLSTHSSQRAKDPSIMFWHVHKPILYAIKNIYPKCKVQNGVDVHGNAYTAITQNVPPCPQAVSSTPPLPAPGDT